MRHTHHVLAGLGLLLSLSAQADIIRICADPDPPPWTYWVRDANNTKTASYVGFSVDTFTTVFGKLGHTVQFIGDVPWSRCLKMVQAGDIDFAMDAYFDSDRAKLFSYSRRYNTLTPQVFYRTQNPVSIRVKADLKRYKGCGMLGASYAHYGLNASDLDLGVNTYQAMIDKLKLGRCDYFVEELEVIAGHKKLGTDFLRDSDLLHNRVTDAAAPAKHLITAKGGKSEKYIPKLNAELERMVATGEMSKLWKLHAGGIGYVP